MSRKQENGFTLIEMSIVLVIIGFIIGGILAGRHLIYITQFRTIASELERYNTATMTFKTKYDALPGDMSNAQQMFGVTACADISLGGNNTCNGDGNGIIEYSDKNGDSEGFRYWQHLALAGLIPGTYSGRDSSNTAYFSGTPGVDAPLSKVSPISYALLEPGQGWTTGWFGYNGSHHVFLVTGPNAANTYAAFSPQDAFYFLTRNSMMGCPTLATSARRKAFNGIALRHRIIMCCQTLRCNA